MSSKSGVKLLENLAIFIGRAMALRKGKLYKQFLSSLVVIHTHRQCRRQPRHAVICVYTLYI